MHCWWSHKSIKVISFPCALMWCCPELLPLVPKQYPVWKLIWSKYPSLLVAMVLPKSFQVFIFQRHFLISKILVEETIQPFCNQNVMFLGYQIITLDAEIIVLVCILLVFNHQIHAFHFKYYTWIMVISIVGTHSFNWEATIQIVATKMPNHFPCLILSSHSWI